jgi:hypothetical protein
MLGGGGCNMMFRCTDGRRTNIRVFLKIMLANTRLLLLDDIGELIGGIMGHERVACMNERKEDFVLDIAILIPMNHVSDLIQSYATCCVTIKPESQ